MKNKETLEETAENYVKDSSHELYELRKQCFLDGYKLAQERSYSEEEVIKFLQQYRYDLSSNKTANLGDTTGLWFEQFKNK